MNITPSVFEKKCPHCGAPIEKQLKQQALETGYGYREHGVFSCNFCEGDIDFRFEWGVVWSEITSVGVPFVDRAVAQHGVQADVASSEFCGDCLEPVPHHLLGCSHVTQRD